MRKGIEMGRKKRTNSKSTWIRIAGFAAAFVLLVVFVTVMTTVRDGREEPAREEVDKSPGVASEPDPASGETGGSDSPAVISNSKSPETVSDSDTGEAVGQTDEKQEAYDRVKADIGKKTWTPYAGEVKWSTLSDAEKKEIIRTSIPVLMDSDRLLDVLSTGKSDSAGSRAWVLTRQLYDYCKAEGIEASEGYFIAYGQYLADGLETCYIELNDAKRMVLLVTCENQGTSWSFSHSDLSKKEVLERNIQTGDKEWAEDPNEIIEKR